jgi:hypothetical protein
MPQHVRLTFGGLAALAATHASAQPFAPPDPVLTPVPPEQRLDLLRVFMDADPIMKILLAGLLVAALVALVVWIVQAVRLGRGGGRGLVGGLAYLSGLAAAGPLIGFFGSAYTLLGSALALANLRPAPTIGVVAPGLAEALLSAALGLLAAAVATIGYRSLKARVHALEVTAASGDTSPAPAASLVRAS